ncbi:MAG: aryl-sulfate sulfohydrolase [Bacteroides sp. SM23_62]|nr:MAG: aryl-sulfate sulfohydrolase [Bacteroides sp. SM23_62]
MIRQYFHSKLFILLTICVFTIAGCKKSQPNIILINIDDMGWRDVGFMGSEYYETPNIDNLAESGMVFTNAYASASNCAPSRACLMSGQWAPRHGIYTVNNSERGDSRDRKLIPTPNTTVLADEFITMAEVLQKAGYRTCHAGKWHLGEDPCTQGFDRNIGGTNTGSPRSYYPPYGNVPLEAPDEEYLTDLIMEHAIEFVREEPGQPFFLYYSPYAVHTPIHPVDSLLHKYEGKKPWNGQENVKYATMIDNLDRNIGSLLSTLEQEGMTDKTLIIFTSDNGGHFGITKQWPLRAGKGSYYEGGIREPLVIAWEGKIEASQRSDKPVTNLDLFPTILESAGLKKHLRNKEALPLDGISLIPHLTKNRDINERPLFWHFPVYLEAYLSEGAETRDSIFRTRPGSVVRIGDWKLHQYFEDGGLELYNLKEDIGEKVNLSETDPDKTQELLNILEEWRVSTGAPVPTELNPDYIPPD